MKTLRVLVTRRIALVVTATVSIYAVTTVNRLARKLRVDLWKKHLALANDEGAIVKPATTVAEIVERPASVETITAIQKLAEANASVYRSNFAFVPWSEAGNGRKGPRGASLWPVCPPHCESNIARQLAEEMPFSETFWTKKHGPSADPEGLSGFFTALPIYWTTEENNQPGEMNVALLTLKEPMTSKSTAYG